MSYQLPAAYEFEKWDVNRVTEWLQRCDFSWQASSYFRSNRISGQRLLEMDDRDIQQLHCLKPNEKSILRDSLHQCKRQSNSTVQDRVRRFGNQNNQYNQNQQPSRTLPAQHHHQASRQTNDQWNHAATLPPSLPPKYPSHDHNDYNGNTAHSHNRPQSLNRETEYDSAGDDTDEWDSDESEDNYIEPDNDPDPPQLPVTGMVASIKAELERRGTLTKMSSRLSGSYQRNQSFHEDPEDIYDTPEDVPPEEEEQEDLYESPSDGSVSGSGGGIVIRPNVPKPSRGPTHGSYDVQQEDVYEVADSDDVSGGRTQCEEDEPELVYEITDSPAKPPPKPGRRNFPLKSQPPQPLEDDTYELAEQQPLIPARPPKRSSLGKFPLVQPVAESPLPARPPKNSLGHRPPPQPVEEDTYEITDQKVPVQQPKIERGNFRRQPEVVPDETYEIADNPSKPLPASRRWPPTPQPVETKPSQPVRPSRLNALPHNQLASQIAQGIQPPRPPKNKKPPPVMEDTYEVLDNKDKDSQQSSQPSQQPGEEDEYVAPDSGSITEDTYDLPASKDLPSPKPPSPRQTLPPRPVGGKGPPPALFPSGEKGPPPVLPVDNSPSSRIQHEDLPRRPDHGDSILSLADLKNIKQNNGNGTPRPLPARPPSHVEPHPPVVQETSSELDNAPYFQGALERKKAIQSLESYAKDGAFLIRNGTKTPYSMSLYHQGKIVHLQIPYENGMYRLGASGVQNFPSVIDLVNHHRMQPVIIQSGGNTVLTQHCPVYR